MEKIINVALAGVTIPCVFRSPETAAWFQTVPDACPIGEGSGLSPASERSEGTVVRISREEWEYYGQTGGTEGPHAEVNLLSAFLSEALLPFRRVVIHGAALRWRGRAYLICAPHAVGKSTQTRFLQELRPGEFDIICGDRPILEFSHCEKSSPAGRGGGPTARSAEGPSADDQIIVHPSPWNGKENWKGAPAAPLAGLILLERGEENRLTRLSSKDAGIFTFLRFIHTNRSEETVRIVAKLCSELLNAVPCWRLTTCQVPDSTRLLLREIFPDGTPSGRRS